jgi:hypothetical protein
MKEKKKAKEMRIFHQMQKKPSSFNKNQEYFAFAYTVELSTPVFYLG